ncbi:hypothetical protein AMTRI_Chr12g275030 [Amborella trichopoda]
MELVRVLLVISVLYLVSIESGSLAREIPGNYQVGIVEKCRGKRVSLCKNFGELPKNTTLDEKRRVPTGPNPLHNR